MTLSELCEPLFVYLCRLNRSARKGGDLEPSRVRSEIKAVFQDIGNAASADPRLSDQYGRVELPLVFFADAIVAESELPFAAEWNKDRLAFEKNELAGDEKFFDLLDETLSDPSEQATERLMIFYTCLGLGFTGWYAGQTEHLQRKMLEMSARIPSLIGVDETRRICPEAYDHVDTSNLIEPPGKKLLGLGIALAGLAAVLVVVNALLFRWTSEDLAGILRQILGREEAAVEETAWQAEEEW